MLIYLINPAVIYPVLCFPPQPISRQPKTIFTSHKQKRSNEILAPSAGLNCRGATSVTFGDLQNKRNAKNTKLQSLSIPSLRCWSCSGEDFRADTACRWNQFLPQCSAALSYFVPVPSVNPTRTFCSVTQLLHFNIKREGFWTPANEPFLLCIKTWHQSSWG